MELLIPGVVFAAALAIIVKAVKFYRRAYHLAVAFATSGADLRQARGGACSHSDRETPWLARELPHMT